MTKDDLIELTAQIVESHVESNRVHAADVPTMIKSVYDALAELGKTGIVAEPEVTKEPAVSIRSSVKPDAIACLECGLKQKTLKRHLMTAHDLSPADYRTKWKLPTEYPIVAPNYSTQRKELALKIGLGRKPGTKVPTKGKRSLG